MSQGCVLIVDDEPINLVLLKSLLEDHYQAFKSASKCTRGLGDLPVRRVP